MEIDKKVLANLLDMDDETLRQAIKTIALTSGFDTKQTDRVISDMKKIKTTLSSVSNDDLKKAVDFIGEDKANEILKQIKKL